MRAGIRNTYTYDANWAWTPPGMDQVYDARNQVVVNYDRVADSITPQVHRTEIKDGGGRTLVDYVRSQNA